jgi:hypothetical protein
MEWISVEDRLPEDGVDVLVYVENNFIFTASHQYVTGGGDYWHEFPPSDIVFKPTHWMPLPEPPEGASDGE